MAKSVSDNVLDAALNYIKNNCDEMQACSQQPLTYTNAVTDYNLADAAMTGTDFTLADGDTSGRKLTVAAQEGEAVDATGDADHVSLTYSGNTELLYVTTATQQSLTSGNTVDFGAWDIEILDPS